ncbi:MAG: hypothetical protein RQ745_00005, partial [Longimicrobiales bacterium]|nr:hypothetical protein [Longimicrobiales bacterium]
MATRSAESLREAETIPSAACPLCGDARASEVWAEADRLYGVPGVWRYVACGGCGSVRQAPRVRDADLPHLYPDRYYTHAGPPVVPAAAGGRAKLREWVREWIRWSVQGGAARPGRVGRATGRLLARS